MNNEPQNDNVGFILSYDLTKDIRLWKLRNKGLLSYMLQTLSLKNENTITKYNFIFPQAENFKSLTKKAEFLETRMGRAVVMMSLSLIK